MRSLFKFVSYWNPSVELDARGNGEFEFEVPDNSTGWRVLVLALTPTDRMGLGQASFKGTVRRKFVPPCRTKSPKGISSQPRSA